MVDAPKRSELSKDALLPAMSDHVLAHGLSQASLRPLAKSAGTSDRMLIYHFGNKEKLIAELLDYLVEKYASALDQGFGDGLPTTRKECVQRILSQSAKPDMQPFMALWWEIVAGCARGIAGYGEAAQAMTEKLLSWLEAHMPADDPDPQGGARYLLTLVEGSQMLSAVRQTRLAREGLVASTL